jgi:DNA-binding GntR family transcriptional regulator
MELGNVELEQEMQTNYYPISEIVYNKIKNLIVTCKFQGGERLLLNNLAHRFGVSITPIREALKQLEKEELVRLIPNKGAEVVNIFIEDVVEIYDIRAALEGLAIQSLCGKVDKDFLGKLYTLYSKSENYLTEKDIISYQEYNKKFHELIISQTENKRLNSMMNQIRDHMSIIIIKNLSLESLEKTKYHAKEHIKIFYALEESNFDLAEKLVKTHIINAKNEILSNFTGYRKIN